MTRCDINDPVLRCIQQGAVVSNKKPSPKSSLDVDFYQRRMFKDKRLKKTLNMKV